MEPSYLARVCPVVIPHPALAWRVCLSISLVSWFYTRQRPLLWGAQTQTVELDSGPPRPAGGGWSEAGISWTQAVAMGAACTQDWDTQWDLVKGHVGRWGLQKTSGSEPTSQCQ